MKRFLMVLTLGLFCAFVGQAALAEKADKEEKTVSGKSACATCEGLTKEGHSILLIDKDGNRWVLLGEGEAYKKAHKVRDEGKKMTATFTAKPVAKKSEDGKEFKEVTITDIKVEA